jgi:hypothetical protein
MSGSGGYFSRDVCYGGDAFADVKSEKPTVDEMSRRLDNLEAAMQSNVERSGRGKSPTKNV